MKAVLLSVRHQHIVDMHTGWKTSELRTKFPKIPMPWVSRKKYDELVYKLECLLCHATGGRLSKASYPLKVMEIGVTDYIERCCDEAVEEALAEREEQE